MDVDGREVKLKGQDNSITIVKVPGGYRNAKKEQSFSGISNPLKENQKAYTGKGNYVCCWDTAQAMVKQKGGSIMHATAERIPTLAQYYSSDLKTLGEQTELGVKYIDSELIAGRPVFVGTDKGSNLKYNADNTTEHYVVIVGKVIKEEKVYYRFYDPGRVMKSDGTNENLLLLLGEDNSLTKKAEGDQAEQNVSQIRRNN